MNNTHRIELTLSVATVMFIAAVAFMASLNTEALKTPIQAQNGPRLTQTASSTPESTVSINNGGFENTVKRGLPKGWNFSGLKTGDRVRCNLTDRPGGKADVIYAHTGKCAFQFIGKPGTKSTLAQNIKFQDLQNFQDVQITAYIQGNNVPKNATKLIFTVIETRSGMTFFKQYPLKLPKGTYDYIPVAHRVRVVAHSKLKNLKLRLVYSGDTGKLLVDNVSVEAFPLPTVTNTGEPPATATPSETPTATATIKPSNTPFGQPTSKPGSGGE